MGVVLKGCAGFHPILCRLCGSCGCIGVWVGECIGSECGAMLGQKSLRGRRLCLV